MEEKFRVIIAGGRDFNDFRLLCKVCMHMLQNKSNVEIVSGAANGADKLGEKFAKFMGYEVKQFPASWDELGKAAGHIRNRDMAEYGDALIAFWDGESKGTKNMILEAEKRNLKVIVKDYKIETEEDIANKEWWEK
tara:strand:+ start:1279 stop:1686 length:408 start_codon:yes stop_codon:yes gene_type:complete